MLQTSKLHVAFRLVPELRTESFTEYVLTEQEHQSLKSPSAVESTLLLDSTAEETCSD